MSGHELNAKYWGLSVVGVVSLILTIWGIYLNYHPPNLSSGASAGGDTMRFQAQGNVKGSVVEPHHIGTGSPQSSLLHPLAPTEQPARPAGPTWGYSFPNATGLYTVRFVGFPDDLDDPSIRSLIRYGLQANQEDGKPTSAITFRATVDPNKQSDHCTSMNGVSAVIDLQLDRLSDQDAVLFKQGSGFACFGSDRKIAELQALGQAFTNMRN